MFRVKNIYTGEIHRAYCVARTSFLFFWGVDENGHARWAYGYLDDHIPLEENLNEN